jgi:hypothetical protein
MQKVLSEYLKSRTPGQGAALPTSSPPQGVDELFKGFNTKVSSLKQTTALEILGNPRETYDIRCQEITNAELSKHMARDSVGPFVVYGLKPAVESFKEIFANVKRDAPDLYDKIGSAGMLCARLIRGSSTAITNHSWGVSIDLVVDGVLTRGGQDV